MSYLIKSAVKGVEPPRQRRQILSLVRLPIPPHRILIYLRKMGRLMGIEPTNAGATIRCVNHFATTAMISGAD